MIKNLLFDLGGVIMDIDRDRCVEAFKELGMANADEFLGVYGQKGDFLALERGEITPEEFRDRLRPYFRPGLTDAEMDAAFCRFLIGIPRHRLEALRRLRKRFGIYLLSNTNAIMWHSKIAEEFRQEGLEMADYFDGIVASFEVNAYKPDAEIFEKTAQICGICPEETLFFDDSERNCEAARACGYQAVHVAPGTEFESLVPEQ